MDEMLVREFRSAVLKNTHNGHICIVTDTGSAIYYAGDADHVTY